MANRMPCSDQVLRYSELELLDLKAADILCTLGFCAMGIHLLAMAYVVGYN
jgi:hypothetical protein